MDNNLFKDMKKILVLSLLLVMAASAAMAGVTYSRELYEKAVMGDGEAMYQLSLCYMNGLGVAADYDKSDYWLERAAQEGQPNAVAAMSAMRGKTGLSDSKRRELASEEKSERERLEKNIDYSKYNEALVKKAQSGDAKAQFYMGFCYEYGFGVSTDLHQAFEWYLKAAKQGYDTAQRDVARFYEHGRGVTIDLHQAFEWYSKAAEQGERYSEYRLACFFYWAKGIQKDYNKAAYWWRKAADQGDGWSQFYLGVCYENGQGVTKDINQAVEWYRKSAQQGDKDAQKALTRLGYSW